MKGIYKIKKLIIALGIAIIASGITIACIQFNTKANTTILNKDQIEKLGQEIHERDSNIEIKVTSELPKINADNVIKAAENCVNPQYSKQASSITAGLCSLTDNSMKQNNTLIWIVTFYNVNVRVNGGKYIEGNNSKSDIIGNINVLINANTGEIIETFAYKTK